MALFNSLRFSLQRRLAFFDFNKKEQGTRCMRQCHSRWVAQGQWLTHCVDIWVSVVLPFPLPFLYSKTPLWKLVLPLRLAEGRASKGEEGGRTRRRTLRLLRLRLLGFGFSSLPSLRLWLRLLSSASASASASQG